jgi:hypothetical protein
MDRSSERLRWLEIGAEKVKRVKHEGASDLSEILLSL